LPNNPEQTPRMHRSVKATTPPVRRHDLEAAVA
jgi:hypothetical protein